MPETCIPPLWAKAAPPTNGWWSQWPILATSATYRERSVSFFICPGGGTSYPIFSASPGMMEQRFALPHRSPYPLIVPCTCVTPFSTAPRELATAISEWLGVWIPSGSRVFFGASRTIFPPHSPGRRQRLHGVLRVPFVPVEKVLGVEEYFLRPFLQVFQRLPDGLQVLVERGSQRLGDVKVPRFSDHGDDGGFGGKERLHVGVLRHLLPHAAGHAERAQFRLLEAEPLSPLEEFLVLGVRGRVAPLAVGDPHL